MSKSVRENIIFDVALRLEHIRGVFAYQTDIGKNVNVGVNQLEHNERQNGGIAVRPGTEELSERAYQNIHLIMNMDVEGAMLFDEEILQRKDAYVFDERMRADIIECLTGDVYTASFTNGATQISVGQTIEGDTSGATAIVETLRVSTGSWSGGDAAGTLAYRARSLIAFQAEDINTSSLTMAAPSGQHVKTIMGNTNIDNIFYVGGGVQDYPDENHLVRGVVCNFEIHYTYQIGNPY